MSKKKKYKPLKLSDADRYRAMSMAYATGNVPIIKYVTRPPKAERQREAQERSANPEKKVIAERLRRNMTEAERYLWRGGLRQLSEYFFPQAVVSGYIADFCCFQHRLIVEIDGEYHLNPDQAKHDAERTKNLGRHNFRIVRFSNQEVMQNRTLVLGKIVEALKK
jgi:5-methyltetrahydrofolate--homocysteine methyltransferase